MNTDRIAFVWKSGPGVMRFDPDKVAQRPVTGVNAWPKALPCDKLTWERDASEIPIEDYDVFLVNLFPQSRHVSDIRMRKPDALIIAMPDPHLERVLRAGNVPMLLEMRQADLIGGRTRHDAMVYGALTDRPGVWLPSPIGPAEIFEQWRLPHDQRGDFILTVDHRSDPDQTAQNVAVVAALQRETGLRVVYCKPMGNTPAYAEAAGLRADFHDQVKYRRFLDLVATAKIGVDMYAGHAQHRHGLTHAMIGTPLVTSQWCNPCGHAAVDPYDTQGAVRAAMALLDGEVEWHRRRDSALTAALSEYSFEASRDRLATLLWRWEHGDFEKRSFTPA